ncbi:MAG: hypothetical protein M1835_003601, partial [Candelina submexicana]
PVEYRLDYRGHVHVPYSNQQRLENEAASLRFINENTNIPVPSVLGAYEVDGSFYLWTELIRGTKMEDLSRQDQAVVIEEVKEHLQSMQNLRSKQIGGPTGIICPPIRVTDRLKRDVWPSKPAHPDDYVFCHNDLSQSNVIVDPATLKVAGIIDWEYAGYFPAYFESPFFLNSSPSGAQAKNMTDTDRLVKFLA